MLRWFKRKEDERKVEAEAVEMETGKIEPERKELVEFAPESPTEGAWLETRDKNGHSLFLPLLRSPLVLGTSEDCDAQLDERFDEVDKVKPQHARLELWRERWVIVPLNRDTLVFVNGKRTGENVLRDGTEIHLGENGVKFVFRTKSSLRSERK